MCAKQSPQAALRGPGLFRGLCASPALGGPAAAKAYLESVAIAAMVSAQARRTCDRRSAAMRSASLNVKPPLGTCSLGCTKAAGLHFSRPRGGWNGRGARAPPCILQPAPPWQRRRSYTAAATPASRHSDAGGVPGAKTKARPTSIQSVWVPVVRWRYVSMQCTKTTSPARMSKKTHHHDGTRLPADIRGLTAASALCSWAHGLLCRPEAAWSASSSNHIIETCFI